MQGLSGDIFARFCRLRGHETLYICGTDEFGTATETRARELGITPRELCDQYYPIHAGAYEWFQLSFDKFGRTSDPVHTEITQGLFNALNGNGFITSKKIEQLYSEESQIFLADRYVRGRCPHCDYEEARGDQCENCGKLLDPSELRDPVCVLDGSVPVKRATEHLYIDLAALQSKLEKWLASSGADDRWAKNALRVTRAWIRDGLRERAITRDLTWGIPVPLDGYRNKVFYVWFDACIGYISITASHTDKWREWWQNPDDVDLFHFVGKDNIPFHTVVFPCTLIGSREKWTMLYNISSSEYLNYEGGQFSKSKGRGVFVNDVLDSGIPSDVWRYYLTANRPESADSSFSWEEFYARINKELIGTFANLYNRISSFVIKNMDGKVPKVDFAALAAEENGTSGGGDGFLVHRDCFVPMRGLLAEIESAMEKIEQRSALRAVIGLATLGNKLFQNYEPWKLIKTDAHQVDVLVGALFELAKNLAIVAAPFLPQTAARCYRDVLGITRPLVWDDISEYADFGTISPAPLLFERLEWKEIEDFRKRFGGQDGNAPAADDGAAGDGAGAAGGEKKSVPPESAKKESAAAPVDAEHFMREVELRVARITDVHPHPDADKLYIETLDDGSGEARQIVSGLVPHYQAQELLNKHIILVANLKAAKLRGVMSNGMLLAASDDDQVVSVLECSAQPGTQVVCQDGAHGSGKDAPAGTGQGAPAAGTGETEYPSLTIDRFFQFSLLLRGGQAVLVDGDREWVLAAAGAGEIAPPLTVAAPLTDGTIG